MRVRARGFDRLAASGLCWLSVGQVFVSEGCEYEVHALVVFGGVLSFLIVDDLGSPGWVSVWVLDVVESGIPEDWVVRADREDPVLICGPDFIAASYGDYEAMVEQEAEKVEKFWERIQRLEGLEESPD